MTDDSNHFGRERSAEEVAAQLRDRASKDAQPHGDAVEYRIDRNGDGSQTYAVREGDTWRLLSEDEARVARVWRDPRREDVGVHDDLATPEQLRVRREGAYDPRPASGAFVARRVIILCLSCGKPLAEVHDFERRYLCHSLVDQRWYPSLTGLKCNQCFQSHDVVQVDGDRVLAALDRARASDRTKTVTVGKRIGVLRRVTRGHG
ncbi:MAG: hypothetical protein ACQEWM_12180 [Actinomycetota bacterium]